MALIVHENIIHEKNTLADMHKRKTTRKRLKPIAGQLGFTKENALFMAAEKEKAERIAEKKKEISNIIKKWRVLRDNILAKGVIARKEEKARVKAVKELQKQGFFVPFDMLTPIHDPEPEWKATNPIWLSEEARKKAEKEEKERRKSTKEEDDDIESVTFIVDIVGDRQMA
ncbi:hypothetical protein MMC14_009197 [Varicellaria rhodocarpa]|nr:hypothetical protein [Varicellaria rhodocarpa]